MHEETDQIASTPAFVTMAETAGVNASTMSSEQLVEFYKAGVEKWKKLIPPLNIKLD